MSLRKPEPGRRAIPLRSIDHRLAGRRTSTPDTSALVWICRGTAGTQVRRISKSLAVTAM